MAFDFFVFVLYHPVYAYFQAIDLDMPIALQLYQLILLVLKGMKFIFN